MKSKKRRGVDYRSTEKDYGIERLGTANMNVLYKYCDQLGIVKILGSLELKLPRISEVNDPLECSPFHYCPKDKSAMKEQWLRTINRNHISPPVNWEQKIDEQFETGEFKRIFIQDLQKRLSAWKQKNFLLSVSQEARNTVMWAHYADKHKGAVIGIDFDSVFSQYGIKMHCVGYSGQRPKINILDDFESTEFKEKLSKILETKSVDWSYEKEFRNIFDDASLMDLEQQGLACLRKFNGKETWFLRLKPESIREIIFGLYTEESLRLAIRKLIARPELRHVKLYQAEESETYTLNLKELA